jgi:enterochelin esterase-like enzyme
MEVAENVARTRNVARLVTLAVIAAFVGLGAIGRYHYLLNYWLYRGFAPPKDPAFATPGSAVRFYVKSAALVGRSQPVDVYLPPGYAENPQQRYPVVYLLHGFPGRPGGFLLTVKAGVDEDVLVAEHRMQPVILVMPFGSTGTFSDKEWANGLTPDAQWETFLARDVVRAVDARYRTIRSGAARAIGGLSEGGYGAINIALHHPGEFRTIESWSGYELADPIKSIFGESKRRLDYNSPLLDLHRVAAKLRRSKTYVWFYSGTDEEPQLRSQNTHFAAALTRARIPHDFSLVPGGHNWLVWRIHATAALLAAADHLQHA